MIKVKTSSYFKQVLTAIIFSGLISLGLFLNFKNGWVFILMFVVLCFYAKDINRCFYLLSDKRKKKI